jgi:hypothetical protein
MKVLKMKNVALETNLRPARINTSVKMWAVIRNWKLLKSREDFLLNSDVQCNMELILSG